jgi:hypothetical protein
MLAHSSVKVFHIGLCGWLDPNMPMMTVVACVATVHSDLCKAPLVPLEAHLGF